MPSSRTWHVTGSTRSTSAISCSAGRTVSSSSRSTLSSRPGLSPSTATTSATPGRPSTACAGRRRRIRVSAGSSARTGSAASWSRGWRRRSSPSSFAHGPRSSRPCRMRSRETGSSGYSRIWWRPPNEERSPPGESPKRPSARRGDGDDAGPRDDGAPGDRVDPSAGLAPLALPRPLRHGAVLRAARADRGAPFAGPRRPAREREVPVTRARRGAVHLLRARRRRALSRRLLPDARVAPRPLVGSRCRRGARWPPACARDLVRARPEGLASSCSTGAPDRGGSPRERLRRLSHVDAPLRRARLARRQHGRSLARTHRPPALRAARDCPPEGVLAARARRKPARQHLGRRSSRRHAADRPRPGAPRAAPTTVAETALALAKAPRRRRLARAAAAELDRRPARLDPGVDAAVHDRMRVEAARRQDACGDRRSRSGLADRDDRPVARQVGLAESEQAIRDVPTAGDVARVALVLLPHVDELGAPGQERLELVHGDDRERLWTSTEDVSGDVEHPYRSQAADRLGRLVRRGGRDDDAPLGEDERGLRREASAGDRNTQRTGEMARRERLDRAHVEDLSCLRRGSELVRLGQRGDERAAVQLDDALHVRGARGGDHSGLRDEEPDVVVRERRIEATLEADGRGRLRAHRLAAQRACDVARVDLDPVPELDDPPQGVEEPLRAVARVDREIGPRGVTDEERVAREDDPRIRAAAAVTHREATMLGAVARRVDAAEHDVAEHDLRSVLHGLVWVLGERVGVNAHRDAVLERETTMPGDVIGVRVRLDRADDPDVAMLCLLEVLLDRECRVDNDSFACARVADEVRGAAERVVDELREDHDLRPYQRAPLFLFTCPRTHAPENAGIEPKVGPVLG